MKVRGSMHSYVTIQHSHKKEEQMQLTVSVPSVIAARSQVGGAWIYSSKAPGACKIAYDSCGRPFPVHAEEATSYADGHANGATTSTSAGTESSSAVLDPSPMYRLRTNIPADLMSYRGFAFKDVSGPFPCVRLCFLRPE